MSKNADHYKKIVDYYKERYSATAPISASMIIQVNSDGLYKRFNRSAFDFDITEALIRSTHELIGRISGFKLAYVKPSTITIYAQSKHSVWQQNDIVKIASASASVVTRAFDRNYEHHSNPIFTAKAFCLPYNNVTDVFVHCAKSWEKASIQTYCTQLHRKPEVEPLTTAERLDLIAKAGGHWFDDLCEYKKFGTFIIAESSNSSITRTDIEPNFTSINNLLIEYDMLNATGE